MRRAALRSLSPLWAPLGKAGSALCSLSPLLAPLGKAVGQLHHIPIAPTSSQRIHKPASALIEPARHAVDAVMYWRTTWASAWVYFYGCTQSVLVNNVLASKNDCRCDIATS